MVEAEPDSDRGSDSSSVNASQVPLFVTVKSPTNEPLSGTGMGLDEGSTGVWLTEGGDPCQRPLVSSTRMETIPNTIIDYRLSLIFIKKSELVEITVGNRPVRRILRRGVTREKHE